MKAKEKGLKRSVTILSVLLSFVKYAVVIAAICLLLNFLGVDVASIYASLGIVALIVGFGAESLVADVVTGTFLVFENQYNVGDIVEVNGFRGTVVRIGIRTTCLKDGGDNIKIINNSQMTNILNRSDKLSKAVCDIGIAYETNLRDLESKLPELLETIQKSHTDLIDAAPQYLGVQELSASAIVLRFVVDVKEENVFQATRMLNRELLLAMQDMNVKLPYNQLEVYSS